MRRRTGQTFVRTTAAAIPTMPSTAGARKRLIPPISPVRAEVRPLPFDLPRATESDRAEHYRQRDEHQPGKRASPHQDDAEGLHLVAGDEGQNDWSDPEEQDHAQRPEEHCPSALGEGIRSLVSERFGSECIV